jgi:alkylhydroperoxidase family enzyme
MNAARQLTGGLSNAVRIWAHTPHVAKFFLPFFVAFERDGAGSLLPVRVRLLALLRTHHVHAASYMLAHHTTLGRAAGLGEVELAVVGLEDLPTQEKALAPAEHAAVAWATQVARNAAKHENQRFDELRQYFTDAQVVELTGLVAIASNADLVYNALRVPLETGAEIRALNAAVAIDAGCIRTYLQSVLAAWPEQWPRLDVGRLVT